MPWHVDPGTCISFLKLEQACQSQNSVMTYFATDRGIQSLSQLPRNEYRTRNGIVSLPM